MAEQIPITDKFPKVDLQALSEDIKILLEETGKYVDIISQVTYQASDGPPQLQLIYRSILRRQHDALTTISELVRLNRGHSATILLRPACEEMIWVKYLKSIDALVAEKMLVHLSQMQIYASLESQQNYFSELQMQQMRLPPSYVQRISKVDETAKHELQKLGRVLGWNLRKRQYFPSMRFLAKKTEELDTYNYLYHATSRSVHFTVHEHNRMIWGRPGLLSISSEHLEKYWSVFALYWGFRLYFDVFVDVASILPDQKPEDHNEQLMLEAAKRIGKFPQVPIITFAELDWSDEVQ